MDGKIFYPSLFEALKQIPDAETFRETVLAIMNFAFYGEETQDLSPTAKIIYVMSKPSFEANEAKKRAGRAGAEARWGNSTNNAAINSANSKNGTAISAINSANSTDTVTVTDTVTDTVKRENVKEKSSRFSPPTKEEVAEYCRVQELTVNADRFVDFYASKDWYVGKNKMKDWKAACRNWHRSQEKESIDKHKANAFHNFTQRNDDLDALEAKLDQQFAEGGM